MKNLKIYEDWNTPPEYEDTPEPQEVGREIAYPETQQLFTPVYVFDEEPGNDGAKRGGNGQIDFDIVRDKTPEQALWAVEVIDDAIPDSYKMEYETEDGEDLIQDTESVLNFATDEFKAGRFTEGIEKHQEDYAHHLVKLVTPEDVDFILEDLYDYLRPGHASYVGKSRVPRPGYNANQYTLRSEEIVRVKRSITALLKWKKKVESLTVGGSNKI
jgi:hypothetical protein